MTNVYDRNTLITAVTNGLQPKYLFFWGHTPGKAEQVGKECLSQWYPAVFVVDGVRYATAEHYMMAEKARLFGDEDVRERIIVAAHPSRQKFRPCGTGVHPNHLGTTPVRYCGTGQHCQIWPKPDPENLSPQHGHRILVEASPMDHIWGIGWSENDPQSQNPEQWRGLNLLGFALMNVRARLLTI